MCVIDNKITLKTNKNECLAHFILTSSLPICMFFFNYPNTSQLICENNIKLVVNSVVQVHRKQPWMASKPLFSLYPSLKQNPQGTEEAVKSGFNVQSFELVIIFLSAKTYCYYTSSNIRVLKTHYLIRCIL